MEVFVRCLFHCFVSRVGSFCQVFVLLLCEQSWNFFSGVCFAALSAELEVVLGVCFTALLAEVEVFLGVWFAALWAELEVVFGCFTALSAELFSGALCMNRDNDRSL